jgi:hypothetical protein
VLEKATPYSNSGSSYTQGFNLEVLR